MTKRTAREVSNRIVSTVFNNLDRNCDWTTPRSTVEYMVAVMLIDFALEHKDDDE
jgi:hypothetical protein